MNNSKAAFEKVYAWPGAVWTRQEPHKDIVELLAKLEPCKAIEFGCGEATDAIYFASQGFEVIGVDISSKALASALRKADAAGVDIHFLLLDLTQISTIVEQFDFAYDRSTTHLLTVEQRNRFIADVTSLLKLGALYFTVSSNEHSELYGGPGPGYRTATCSTTIYFSPFEELLAQYIKHFEVVHARVVATQCERNKGVLHFANSFLLRRPIQE